MIERERKVEGEKREGGRYKREREKEEIEVKGIERVKGRVKSS